MSPLLRTLALAAVGVAAAAGLVWLGLAWNDSRLPDSYNVMDLGYLDYGGGAVPSAEIAHGPAHHDPEATSVASFTGPAAGRADARFTLTAQHGEIHLPSGRDVDALTFGGRVPGPELRVHQGDLVEVNLLNRDVHEGVSIHWHGVDVPNAED